MLKPARPCLSTSTSASAMIRSRVRGAARVDRGGRLRPAAGVPDRTVRRWAEAEGAVRRDMLAILRRKDIGLQATYGVRLLLPATNGGDMETIDVIGLLVPFTYFAFLLIERIKPAREFPPRKGWQWLGIAFLLLILQISTFVPLLSPA